MISLRGARITFPQNACSIMDLAARELSSYLYQLSGIVSPLVDHPPKSGVSIVLNSGHPTPPRHLDRSQDQRFALKVTGRTLALVGATPLGTLHGVYALLQQLGVGFYLGGDTFPDGKIDPVLPEDLNLSCAPVFSVRGSNLHGNLLIGAGGWGEQDWRFYLDQMARMQCNLFMLHNYDCEPCAGYERNGAILAQGRPHSSLTPAFGIRPRRTSEFAFGTEVYFDQEVCGAPPVDDTSDPCDQAFRMQEILREALRYGRLRGVWAAVGFEAPTRVDPTNPEVRHGFEERLRQFLRRYPDLAYFVLWQCEGQGLLGEDPPASEAARELIEQRRGAFEYLTGNRRLYAGVHLTEFALLAHKVLQEEFPCVRLVVAGWGGDRWMRFADYAQGLHALLPDDVIFTCHDNTDPTFERTVSEAWRRLPPQRQRWAQPWLETDSEEMWTRQANVEALGNLLPDALAKQCQGVVALHWRTRDFEEELGYLARFAWDPTLTPDQYYGDCARRMFGADQQQPMEIVLGELQRLGGRWTGIKAGWECESRFCWGGPNPHWAHEADREAVELVRRAADKAKEFFAANNLAEAATSFEGIAARLTAVADSAGVSSEAVSRSEMQTLCDIDEEVFSIRTDLLATDTPPETWVAVDQVMLPLHHLTHRADHASRTDQLRAVRDLAAQSYRGKEEGSLGERSERYEFLLSTLDVVLALDRVTVALAEPGPVAEQLSLARAAKEEGKRDQAIGYAVAAYEMIVAARFSEVLHSQARKLTTQCEWGVLALMNLKAVPCYWETLGQAEDLLPAVPPRELRVLLEGQSVRIHWEGSESVAGYHVYRRRAGDESFQRISPQLVPSPDGVRNRGCAFVDRPPEPGLYEYAVTACDGDSWESPESLPAAIACGLDSARPDLLGIKQGFCIPAGREHEVRILAPPVPGEELANLTLRYRLVDDPVWRETPMRRRYRHGYHGYLPPFHSQSVAVEFYACARTVKGKSVLWPQSAVACRYWIATIIPDQN
ncbi:MAG: hypothetical protein HY318_03695 [Armatimonadetes bacterium]|nr:hypothetical protein [Armatimonadota bacterium]